MLTIKEYKNIKIGDKLYVKDNLYEIMKDNWNDDMYLTINQIGKVIGIDENLALIIIQFDILKNNSKDYFYYDRRCLFKQLPARFLYKPRKKVQI